MSPCRGIASLRSTIAAWIVLTACTAGAATVECVSTTGPAGGTTSLEFRVTAEEGESVGGTQNSFTFDTSVFDAAEPGDDTPNCTINPAIGPGTVTDKRLADAFVDDDPARVIAFVFAQQNQVEIPDGALFTCTLAIAAEAPREAFAIQLFNVLVSDPDGDLLPSQAVSCEITVVEPPTPTATPTPVGFCEDDEDCPEGQICIDNRCATLTPTPEGYCEDDEDCPEGQICIDNRCATPEPTPTPEGFCEDDEDCPEDQVCIDNRCATPTPIGFCEDDEDCPEGQICIDNRCATVTPTPIGFCDEDEDCDDGEICVDNRCVTPTPRDDGGGGCDCSIEPDPPSQAALNLLIALLPVLLLRRRRT